MDENPKDCNLQWSGHAGYVTTRFSGLLARQALVDVTLICEEQKLRVHKLVLASSSTYFEEILQQDLGEEPIIFLRDMKFEIVKAMVEFMYCGETTISHECLPSLLNAANIFQMKELTRIIDQTMKDKNNTEINEKEQRVDSEAEVLKDLYCHNGSKSIDTCLFLCTDDNSDTNSNENHSLENNIIINDVEQNEHTLYEEPYEEREKVDIDTSLSFDSDTRETHKDNKLPINCTMEQPSQEHSENNEENDTRPFINPESKHILYEQYCDLSDITEVEQVPKSLPPTCLQQSEENIAQRPLDNIDISNKVGKCIKVYTHKRRNSVDEVRNTLVRVNNFLPSPACTDSIDLLDEPSSNGIPVALLPMIDMDSAEYILSLSAENIQSIVGGTLNDQQVLNNCKNVPAENSEEPYDEYSVNSQDTQMQHILLGSWFLRCSMDNKDSDSEKPLLRRSRRLIQQECDERTSDTVDSEDPTSKAEVYTRTKRKPKDLDRNGLYQTNTVQATKRKLHSRTHRNNSKLIVKKSNKHNCSVVGKEKYEPKSKSNNKVKCEVPEKTDTTHTSINLQNQMHSIETINRALWGDMSDILENSQSNSDMSEYTSDKEIPFAVGLLPLRTALERMQATLDYQPRKTRSSVALVRQDVNWLKRKNSALCDTPISAKKQNNSNSNSNVNTVCHIQIRTTPSQYVKSRKKFSSDHISAFQSETVIPRQ